MEQITLNQTKEIDLLVDSMSDTLVESLSGTAKVAKAIQTYLGCSFTEAVNVLSNIIEVREQLANTSN